MKKIFLILFSFLLVACVPNNSFSVPQSPALKFLERKSGTIAYIGNDGNVHLIDQSGTSNQQLTNDITAENKTSNLYRLPTWSRDSTQLAFMRLAQISQNNLNSEIYVANLEDETINKIYSSNEFPIYMNWSPNNKTLSLLSEGSQSIILKNIFANGSEPKILDVGAPFYFSYAPDGSTMLVHKNGVENTIQQLAFLKTDSDVLEYVLDEQPASFQAPAWSPSGEFILLSTVSDNKQQIVLTDSAGENPKVISDVQLNSAFAWAPDSEQFAYILGEREIQNGALGSLHVGDIFGTQEIVIDEDVLGFFWSPDSKQLAYFIPFVYQPENEDGTISSEKILLVSLRVLDVKTGASREVAVYPPSDESFSILPYIDQYHQSVTIWSPDSNNLVISFIQDSGVPAIAIVPASGVTEPRFLVEGNFAVWSWE
jgi:Tol biopolymer transport system component